MLHYFDGLDLFVCIVILVILLTILWFRKRSLSYLFCFSVFWIYLLFVVQAVVYPFFVGNANETFKPNINLIPFYFGDCSLTNLCIRGIVENIALTVPFGFGVSFIARLKARDFLWLAVVVGLGLEATQLTISLAFKSSFRAIDINDALLNAVGVWLGYGFFRFFSWLYLTITQHFRIKHRGLLAYIYSVTSQSSGSTC